LLTVTIVYGLYEEVVKNKAKDQKQRWDQEKIDHLKNISNWSSILLIKISINHKAYKIYN
jgi:hypothetical protein